MKNKFIFFLAVAVLLTTTTVCATTFSDLVSDHWALEYVTVLAEKEVINGYPDGTFNPEGTISKAEFMKLLIAASLPEGVSIETAPSAMDHWAGKYLFAAQTYKIVEPGAINKENIDQPITRREMALMIAKADVNLRRHRLNSEKPITFNDYEMMDASELKYLAHTVGEGYITGYPDNTFGPDQNMTRAESATVIYRYTGEGE